MYGHEHEDTFGSAGSSDLSLGNLGVLPLPTKCTTSGTSLVPSLLTLYSRLGKRPRAVFCFDGHKCVPYEPRATSNTWAHWPELADPRLFQMEHPSPRSADGHPFFPEKNTAGG